MMKSLKVFFSNMFGKNSSIYEKPLNNLSILLLIAFDIFLFYNILSGYNHQKDFIISPYEKYSCVNFFQNNNDLLDNISYFSNNYPSQDFSGEICTTLYKEISQIKDSQEYNSYKSQAGNYENLLFQVNNKKYNYEKEYKDFLEESSAGVFDEKSRLSDINRENAKQDYILILEQIEKLNQELGELKSDFIKSNIQLQDTQNFIEENKDSFLRNYKKEVFLYPVKIVFFQTLLLLPLFLISLFFYKIFLRRQNKIFTILFSNLTFITGIFIFLLFLKIVYFILPKKIFVSFIALLKSLSIGFLWNYILVIFGVIIFGFVIYLSQKGVDKIQKIKQEQERLRIEHNKKKVQIERFSKGLCLECHSKLLPESIYCQSCGEDQYYECNTCQHLIPKIFNFCNKCGKNHSN